MGHPHTSGRFWPIALSYCGVSLVGFVVDVAMVRLMIRLGLEPAWARVVSLLCAMHTTFVLNGLHVFRQLQLRTLPGQWARYMLCNGFGNLCNYWLFVTLVSTHWPVIAAPSFAVAAGSVAAWAINFAATRFVVFPHRPSRASPQDNGPSPTGPESARP
ncbi:MAG TPA: GtrA family protein [Caulobacteraceae bacterium]|nr:GtrA family protein [Caulobacteraceae bacterium]